MDDTKLVGFYQGAALWQGSPQSFLSLHPAGATTSVAQAVRGNMQVGTVIFSTNHCALWRGTPASFVDLHPAGAVRSFGRATDGVLQGGYSDWPTAHASIWNGTAQSFVDLNPSPNTYSRVYGMAPGIQVGVLGFSGGEHAALWRGTPQSFVDLNPPGSNVTILYATTGRFHVGQAVLGGAGLARAAINFGTAGAWLNLHPFLPPQYTSFSAANAVYQNGPTVYVGGYAENGDKHAILWIGTDPCYANCDQSTGIPSLTANDFMCFLNHFAARDGYANCDQSTGNPTLTANDFQCFLNKFAGGCS